jgi:hypothetical protein
MAAEFVGLSRATFQHGAAGFRGFVDTCSLLSKATAWIFCTVDHCLLTPFTRLSCKKIMRIYSAEALAAKVQACTSQHSGETRALAPSGTRTKRPCQLVETNDHVHGPGCGHDAVPHGDHIDWLVRSYVWSAVLRGGCSACPIFTCSGVHSRAALRHSFQDATLHLAVVCRWEETCNT